MGTTPATPGATVPLKGWIQAGTAQGRYLFLAGSSLQVVYLP